MRSSNLRYPILSDILSPSAAVRIGSIRRISNRILSDPIRKRKDKFRIGFIWNGVKRTHIVNPTNIRCFRSDPVYPIRVQHYSHPIFGCETYKEYRKSLKAFIEPSSRHRAVQTCCVGALRKLIYFN